MRLERGRKQKSWKCKQNVGRLCYAQSPESSRVALTKSGIGEVVLVSVFMVFSTQNCNKTPEGCSLSFAPAQCGSLCIEQ